MRRCFISLATLALVSVCFFVRTSLAEPVVKIAFVEQWGNVFADKEYVFHVQVTAQEKFEGVLGWRFTCENRTIASREVNLAIDSGAAQAVDISLQVPQIKEGVTMASRLSLSAMRNGENTPSATADKGICIFPANAFAYRHEWLEKLNIHLFDPGKKTGDVLTAAKIPFRQVNNIDSFTGITNGMLLIGESCSFKDYRGLGEQATKVAAGGVPVLFLAPSGGEMQIAGVGDSDLPVPQSVHLKHKDVIRDMDKHLDSDSWPPDGVIVKTSMKSRGERGIVFEAVQNADGWPWIEINFSPTNALKEKAVNGRLVLCGFGIVEKWDSTPVARYLLARILEHLSGKDGNASGEEELKR